MFKQKRVQATCKSRKCGFTELRPYVQYPSAPGGLTMVGLQMQREGARMSPLMGGHKKGGYEATANMAEAARAAKQEREICPQCMGKLRLVVVRVKV